MSNPKRRLRAVIFDWAGTLIDHGSRAPAAAFQEVFRRRGVPVSTEDARAPMGLAKRDHLAAMLEAPAVRQAWRDARGGEPGPDDLDALYEDFVPVQCEILPRYADLIPGAVELAGELRGRSLSLGSTTGYSRAMMDVLIPLAAEQGLCLDTVVCANEVSAGRPKPWMLFAAAEALDAYPPRAVVSVDDTPAGVEAGRNAGMWSVGVTRTGNELGLSLEELDALPAEERAVRFGAAANKLEAAGAAYVVESVTELPAVLDRIEERLA